jgi:hypothetical protein
MALLYENFISRLKIYTSPSYSFSRFDDILESEGDYEEDGFVIPYSKIASMKRFYETTNEHNRAKIREMINNNIENADRAYNLVLEAEYHKGNHKRNHKKE